LNGPPHVAGNKRAEVTLKFLNISSSGLPSSKSILSFEIALDVERNFQHYFFRCFLDVHSFFLSLKGTLPAFFFT